MKKQIVWFVINEKGQGMVEYSLILALVILASIGAVYSLRDAVEQLYENILSSLLM